jgi:hypothetical protein
MKSTVCDTITTSTLGSVNTATSIKPPNTITQPSMLNLPTVPVPESSLITKAAPGPMPITVNRPLLGQSQQPGSTVLQQRIGTTSSTGLQQTSTVTLRGVRPQLPGQLGVGVHQTRLPTVPVRQMTPQPQQILPQQRPQQPSQLQGLLQQQTLVPQERLPIQQPTGSVTGVGNMVIQQNSQIQQQPQQQQQ